MQWLSDFIGRTDSTTDHDGGTLDSRWPVQCAHEVGDRSTYVGGGVVLAACENCGHVLDRVSIGDTEVRTSAAVRGGTIRIEGVA